VKQKVEEQLAQETTIRHTKIEKVGVFQFHGAKGKKTHKMHLLKLQKGVLLEKGKRGEKKKGKNQYIREKVQTGIKKEATSGEFQGGGRPNRLGVSRPSEGRGTL